MTSRPVNSVFVTLLAIFFLAIGSLAAQQPVQRATVQPQRIGYTINLNTADVATLTLLRGIGPRLAEAVIEYRDQQGPFQMVDELTDVKGIGPKKLATIRDYVSVK